MPGHEGLAFGLTTLALLAGSTPTFFLKADGRSGMLVLAAATALAAIILFFALNDAGRTRDRNSVRSKPDGPVFGIRTGRSLTDSRHER